MHVAENLSASGLGQLPRLGVNALALSARRYPCVTVFHGASYAANLRSKKAQSFQRPNLAANLLIFATSRGERKKEGPPQKTEHKARQNSTVTKTKVLHHGFVVIETHEKRQKTGF